MVKVPPVMSVGRSFELRARWPRSLRSLAISARLSLGEIAALRSDLSARARRSKLRLTDITGGTFTISNLGMFDVDEFTAIITPPQSAILTIGRIADRVVAVNGQPAVRPMMTLTLASDHRVIDGARAALFMRDLVKEISHRYSGGGGN